MNSLIDRREALRRTALLMGAAVSASTVSAFLYGCKSTPELNYKPVFFSEDQARLISEVAEIILPKTDTPGAKEVGVPNFIDMRVKDCYKEEDQKNFMDGLAHFEEASKKELGDSFIQSSAEKQLTYVKKVHEEAVKAAKADPKLPRPFILKLKELTMLGYFVSEPGATKVLQYIAVPGAYHGCIPLAEAGNGKAWA
jgi:gluconate 2-dehydrogenase gamma chain